MPKYSIEKGAGEFRIVTSYAGTPLVWNGKSSKGSIKIPCRDQNHANQVMEKIRAVLKDEGGEIWV